MEKRMPSPLTVGFDYTGPIADGQDMQIAADGTAVKFAGGAYIGKVYAFDSGALECTLVVPYIWHRDDRIAGEAVVPGFIAIGADGKAYQYRPAAPARHDGTAVGPKDITTGSNDVIKLKLEGGSSQTVTHAAGTGRTFAAIAAEANAALTGMKLEVDAAGNLNIVALELGKSVEVETVVNNAYTALGWTVGVYQPVNASHDAVDKRGVALKAAAKDAAVATLEN